MNELDDKQSLNELHLFAGAGGGIIASELLGHRTVCAVEFNEYARNVLVARQNDGTFPAFPIWDDVRTFDGKPWRGIVDIVSGGFPCQDVSVAGKGAGLDGERSGLWSEFARIIGEVRPRYAFIENSPMLTNRGLDRVLCDLASMGYDAEWCVLSAADVGAPHLRERVWILGYANSNSQSTIAKHDETSGMPIMGNPNNNGQAAAEVNRGITSGGDSGEAGQVEASESTRSSEQYAELANTDGTHGERNERAERSEQERTIAIKSSWWKAEPELGGKINGMARGHDLSKSISRCKIMFWLVGFCDDYERCVSEVLRVLRCGNAQEAIRVKTGRFFSIPEAAILFAELCEYQNRPDKARIFMESAEILEGELRGLQGNKIPSRASHRSGYKKQPTGQYSDIVQILSQFFALDGKESWEDCSWENAIPRVADGVAYRSHRLTAIGNGQVPQCAATAFRLLKARIGH
jgi:DNA (cytosine-5)-methyltransferase 1